MLAPKLPTIRCKRTRLSVTPSARSIERPRRPLQKRWIDTGRSTDRESGFESEVVPWSRTFHSP